MHLYDVWFTLIAVLWTGYFFLEGFDFGVGMLAPVMGRTDTERRTILRTIGPVWDGNEVWLLVAGGATFAAFPHWYATLFSGFYLPLLLILVALILRGMALEYRGKGDTDRWRTNWDRALFFGSFLPALLWGVAFANIVRGVPIDKSMEYTGGFWNLLNGYALLGGLTTLSVFLLHGMLFVSLKTDGDVRTAAVNLAHRQFPVAIVIAGGFLLWTEISYGTGRSIAPAALAAVALVAAWAAHIRRRDGWAFGLNGAAIALTVAALFLALYPNVMPSSTDAAFSLTVSNASSTPYTLKVMTWVAALATPVVLAYQAWTFWVFRKRVTATDITPNRPSVPPQRATQEVTPTR